MGKIFWRQGSFFNNGSNKINGIKPEQILGFRGISSTFRKCGVEGIWHNTLYFNFARIICPPKTDALSSLVKMKIEIVPAETAYDMTKNFPNIAYTAEFLRWQKKRQGLDSFFIGFYQAEKLTGLMPVNYSPKGRAYSVFKDYTEPLLTDGQLKIDWPEVAQAIRKKFGYDYFEMNFGFVGSSPGYLPGFKTTPLSFFVLKLGDGLSEEAIFEKFDKKTRNQIRKGKRSEFILKVGGAESLEKIYALYRENMQRHGTPAKSLDYFQDLFDCFGPKCLALMAYDGERLAGVNLAIANNNYLRLMFNLSEVEYWDKCVNDFLYYKMIGYGYGQGVRVFDFGPSASQDISHNHFKLGFGARQFPIVNLKQGAIRYFIIDYFKQKKFNFKIFAKKLWKNVSIIRRKK